ncbi:ribosomal large subunit pseudouridine synthase D [Lishizhenia tianjinensis]|uniref:Pseudouridine synthase n=1 Tax=Lishizhenia tianjinensis TaxID=477690 RepID=A0A1I7BM21_9FLAO|nr:RluA family pseudouridine synthase [Lishizhenia tianjinensis]SFT88230.1 ribosomal large subunit pseudouridine synthase D [Lishizhenia tianjinensis]
MSEEIEDFNSESEELFEHHKVVADKGQEVLRVDKFLLDRLPNTTRNKIQTAAKNGNIHANGKAVKQNYKVKPDDVITVEFPYPVREIELIPEDIPLEIHYEDDTLLVVNKPAEMVVHPGYGNYTGTLVNALVYHIDNLPQKTEDYYGRPGLVHRLDKNTTGLMVIAKTEHALTHLAKQFFDRTTERRYHALVWGDIEEDGTITGHIGRSLKNRKVMDVFPEGEHGKHAVTHYKVIRRFGYVTLVECKLETGRTHQIRAHFKSIGHPLFNDNEYGGDKILKGTTFTKYRQFVENCFALLPGQALHAKTLGFQHPVKDEYKRFDSDLPANFQAVLDKWEVYMSSREV